MNLTPEEEKFYYSLIDTLKSHRNTISLEKLSDELDSISDNPIIKPQSNTLTSRAEKPSVNPVEEVEKPVENPIIKPKVEPQVKPKVESKPAEDIETNPNAFDDSEEFYDFESKKIAKESELVTMLVFDEVGAIVGVDEKVYGPFRPQDIVTLPLINAKVFFKNRKGRQVKI